MIDDKAQLITGENYAKALPAVKDGYTIRDCNLSQRKAHTAILSGVTGLRFEGCNLKNCDLPKDAVVIDCLYDPREVCALQQDIVEETEQERIEKEIDRRVQKAVDEMAECSFLYPDKASAKLKAKVDKATTEGLLSADGAPVSINAPQGWKK